ncbi:HlyIII domain-containing protein [Rhizoctonia solani AG-1 IA]|uniref:HlyIII domain-containing protein n=1 Tax=Thanatephorus cucumeris (strain AG1-IA) TaxID=983506 RepID=L8WNH9_THACA|nr:HlyIII domain-containing protein [Rhizoctonia solani AG-1 IA]
MPLLSLMTWPLFGPDPKWRIAFFLLCACSAMVPLGHLSYKHSFSRMWEFIDPLVPSLASYLTGLAFYATHFPECCFPGWFDWAGSHAIWHVFIVIGEYRIRFWLRSEHFSFRACYGMVWGCAGQGQMLSLPYWSRRCTVAGSVFQMVKDGRGVNFVDRSEILKWGAGAFHLTCFFPGTGEVPEMGLGVNEHFGGCWDEKAVLSVWESRATRTPEARLGKSVLLDWLWGQKGWDGDEIEGQGENERWSYCCRSGYRSRGVRRIYVGREPPHRLCDTCRAGKGARKCGHFYAKGLGEACSTASPCVFSAVHFGSRSGTNPSLLQRSENIGRPRRSSTKPQSEGGVGNVISELLMSRVFWIWKHQSEGTTGILEYNTRPTPLTSWFNLWDRRWRWDRLDERENWPPSAGKNRNPRSRGVNVKSVSEPDRI